MQAANGRRKHLGDLLEAMHENHDSLVAYVLHWNM